MLIYDDIRFQLNNLKPKLDDLKQALDLDKAQTEIAQLEEVLSSQNKMKKVIVGELQAVAQKYDTGRRSEILYDVQEAAPETEPPP